MAGIWRRGLFGLKLMVGLSRMSRKGKVGGKRGWRCLLWQYNCWGVRSSVHTRPSTIRQRQMIVIWLRKGKGRCSTRSADAVVGSVKRRRLMFRRGNRGRRKACRTCQRGEAMDLGKSALHTCDRTQLASRSGHDLHTRRTTVTSTRPSWGWSWRLVGWYRANSLALQRHDGQGPAMAISRHRPGRIMRRCRGGRRRPVLR